MRIRYAQMNRQIKRLEALIKGFDKTVKCTREGEELFIKASEIYYAESVDKHTFVYGREEVYGTEQRLYRLLEELEDSGFVRVSKACILNIHMLQSIRPLLNSRMEAVLLNGEKINVTRKYVAGIKEKLD